MKLLSIFALLFTGLLLTSGNPVPQVNDNSLVGAWQLIEADGTSMEESGQSVIRIFSPTYTMVSSYHLEEKTFQFASGGPYTFDGETGSFTVDYHSSQSEMVGTTGEGTIQFEDGMVLVTGTGPNGESFSQSWKQLDEGGTPLSGSWRISERMREGEMVPMKRGPRKTIKILSGTRFQWAAMNTETKQFMGTGGGTYTFEGGKYTETIEFFSRDNSRVGMSLGFDGKVEEGAWHHSGKSSKGNPISEIWRQE